MWIWGEVRGVERVRITRRGRKKGHPAGAADCLEICVVSRAHPEGVLCIARGGEGTMCDTRTEETLASPPLGGLSAHQWGRRHYLKWVGGRNGI